MNENTQTAGRTAIQRFSYEGQLISFDPTGAADVMVNATEMAKTFGKNVRQWFDNPGTHEFIETLAHTRGIQPIGQKRTSLNASVLAERYPELVKVVKGGIASQVTQGTWMHEDVAMEFARWLSPKFAIWCNDRIKELLRSGVTSMTTSTESRDDDETLFNAMQILQRRIEEKERRLQEKEQRLQLASTTIEQQGQRIVEQRNEIATLTPMADYTREVLQSTSTFTLTQVAKDLGLRSVMVLTEFCREARILYRQSGQWLPTAKYSGKGFFETRTAKYVKSDNTIGTSLSTVVTEKGRVMLRKMMEQKGGVA